MPVGPGYTSSGIDNAFKVNSLAAKKAFPDKVVLLQPNFYDGDISVFRQWLADNGIGIGVPDVVPKSSSITFDFAADFLKLHNQIPTAPDVQWDNYERCKEPPHWSGCTAPGTYFTSVELLEAVVRGDQSLVFDLGCNARGIHSGYNPCSPQLWTFASLRVNFTILKSKNTMIQ